MDDSEHSDKLPLWVVTRGGTMWRDAVGKSSPFGHPLPFDVGRIDAVRVETLAFALAHGDARAVDFATCWRPVFPNEDTPHVGERWCGKCREWKVTSGFAADATRKDGIEAYCRKCKNVAAKERRQKQRVWRNGYSSNNSSS